jgi:hypothetical protein
MTTLFVYRRLQELASHPLPELQKETPEPAPQVVEDHSPHAAVQPDASEVAAESTLLSAFSERTRDS